MIYLDNAATTLNKPDQVIEAVVNAMKTQGNASRGAHGATLSASRVVYDARVKIAKFFNFDKPLNVIFTCNSTEALNIAINGTINDGDKVISTDTEHNSVLRPLYHLKKSKNIDLQFVNANSDGILDLVQFEKICDEKTKVVVVNHISNLTGNVNDIKAISKITHKVGAILIVDGSQSAGTRTVDVKDLGIDIYCFTGHKSLLGPQGTGGILVRDGIEVAAWKRGGSGVKTYEEDQPYEYPTRLEAGTLNSHGIAGLSAAIDFLNEVGVENIQKKERELIDYFYKKVKEITGIKVYGDFTSVEDNKYAGENSLGHAAIVSLNVKDYDSGEVSDALSNDYGIATRPGAHCAPRLHIALGTKYQGAVRFSFSYFTTKEELDVAINALKEIAS
jgi:cysteine desulfurase family protein